MTRAVAARRSQYRTSGRWLYVAFELGEGNWKLGFTTGMGRRPRERVMSARDVGILEDELKRAKRRFGLAADAPVVSCYEAGREGFWLHRYLEAAGVANVVVDSSSIEVKRGRRRRVKTDRLDVKALLRQLIRWHKGERDVWSVVHVPGVEAEDARHLHRELVTLKRDRARVTNRIKGLLATQGVRVELSDGFLERLEAVRLWDGSELPPGLWARLGREWEKVAWLTEQIREVEAERRELLRTWEVPAVEQVKQLMRLRGIGINAAWLWVMEFFGWRAFRNRREVAGLAGLTPTPYQSGDEERDQGINKAGNRWVRWMAIELAWAWLRFQPQSELSQWYQRRFGGGSKRIRKIGIVALARRLLIELWRYLETGALPAGAVTKA